MNRHRVSLMGGQTCVLIVFYTVFKQIWNYCFWTISSRELFVCLISYDFSNYEVLVMSKMMIRIKMVIQVRPPSFAPQDDGGDQDDDDDQDGDKGSATTSCTSRWWWWLRWWWSRWWSRFGHHLLHHFFPAVDISKLEHLYPALQVLVLSIINNQFNQ